MWIEQRPIKFAPISVKQKGEHYLLEVGKQTLEISARQYEYFDHLAQGMSLNKMVLDFIEKGWVVSFREIYSLVEALVNLRWIANPEFQSYFNMINNSSAAGVKDIALNRGQVVANPDLIKNLPFFRTLQKDILNLFIRHTRIQNIPANTRICKMGDFSKEMYAMIKGTVGVYRIFPDGKRQLMSTIPEGSIFGEGGFLLGRPRGADVISLQPTTLAVIDHHPELEGLVDSGKADALQQRFWVLQGLLASEVFSHVPSETLDSLVFAGKIINAKEGMVLTREGDPGTCLYIIIQGSIVFTQKGKSLRALNQGGIFGEVALMVSGGKRTATAQAQRDSILLQIDMAEFYTILSNHLVLAKEIEAIAWKRWDSRIQ